MLSLILMLKLQLEHHSVPPEDSIIDDSCMLEIKSLSHPDVAGTVIHQNSISKVNTTFNKFVINYLSIQFLFDNWYPFAAQGKMFRIIVCTQSCVSLTCISLNKLFVTYPTKEPRHHMPRGLLMI